MSNTIYNFWSVEDPHIVERAKKYLDKSDTSQKNLSYDLRPE